MENGQREYANGENKNVPWTEEQREALEMAIKSVRGSNPSERATDILNGFNQISPNKRSFGGLYWEIAKDVTRYNIDRKDLEAMKSESSKIYRSNRSSKKKFGLSSKAPRSRDPEWIYCGQALSKYKTTTTWMSNHVKKGDLRRRDDGAGRFLYSVSDLNRAFYPTEDPTPPKQSEPTHQLSLPRVSKSAGAVSQAPVNDILSWVRWVVAGERAGIFDKAKAYEMIVQKL